MFGEWTILQIDDHVMHQRSDVMHMDLDMFGSLSLHRVSTKLESTLMQRSSERHHTESA
jgi:hypothetical protein